MLKRQKRKPYHRINKKNLYILPSAFGWVFAFSMLGMFIGAINYQISTLFLFTFLLAICAMSSAIVAHKNLDNIRIRCLPIPLTAAFHTAEIEIECEPNHFSRFDLNATFLGEKPQAYVNYINGKVLFSIRLCVKKRGRYSLAPIKIFTRYPLGLFTVWTWLLFKQEYIVYPEPLDTGNLHNKSINPQKKHTPSIEDDDLKELRQIENPWSNRSKIAWKIAARGQGWFMKQFESQVGEHSIFRLKDLPGNDVEKKLRQLSFLVLSADKRQEPYALQLENETVIPQLGEQHLQDCLTKLALYQ